ncbi:MAG: hypothetical protein L0338_30495 [Acidobacteria bacterium]|nr:hypothetical protein [Acidobacteriota bacterium]
MYVDDKSSMCRTPEIYLRTQDRAGPLGRFPMAGGLLVLTAAMGVGIFMATMFMWLPRI